MIPSSVPRLNLDLLFRVPNVAGYDLDKSGKMAAISWNKSGQHEIYLLETTYGSPQQVTFPPESKAAPRFSPAARELVHAQDHQGDELYDLYLMDLETKKTRNITPNTPEAIYPGIRWSPDGKQIAFSCNKSGKFSIYTMEKEGGEHRLLHHHEYLDYGPEWSPDGKRIAFTSLTRGQDQGVFIAALDAGEAVQLADGENPVEASSPKWSPDGETIAFVSTDKGMSDIGLYSLRERTVSWLTDGTYECDYPVWSLDGQCLAYECNIEGNLVVKLQKIANVEPSSRPGPETIQMEPGIHSQIRFSPSGEELFFLYNGPKYPSDLWKYSFKARKFGRLTSSLPLGLDTSGFVTPTPVHYGSSDGRSIPALLFVPDEKSRKKAAVVYVHGGPTAQFVNLWHPLIQEYVDRGYAVVAPNYRGSTGYGREFRDANRFVMGKLDLDDVVKSADFLLERGLAEPDRIAMTGGSFGGYLTMCALTKYPELWAAGSALVPFLNWFTEMENEREDLQYWDKQNMGDPEKDKERLRDASPIFFIDKVNAPVQIIAGAHDPRCPVSETLQAKEALEKAGKKVDVVIYEDEGHGFLKLDNRLDAFRKSVDFLSAHLH